MSGELTLGISYFGKLPGDGDFLKASTNHHQLIAALDRWAGSALELLARDLAWKQLYDLGQPLNFALLASRKRSAIAGHLLPSSDASGRRYPFMTAVSLDVPRPLEFMSRSPLAFSRLWARLERLTRTAHDGADPRNTLQQLVESRVNVNVLYEALNPAFQDLLEMQTLGTLQTLLSTPESPVSISRVLIALGILLQPVMGAGSTRMAKGLVLPLPRDPLYRNLVSCLWLDLISGFLGRADFELLLLLRHDGPALLAVGFNGLQGHNLQAMFDRSATDEHYIPLYDPEWVDEHAKSDAGLRKLVAYTENGELSLRTARHTFRETFLGA